MAYTVPKLKDYSAAALDKAVRELLSALEQESKAIANESDWKAFRDRWMARKNGVLTQVNERWLKPAPKDAKREVGQRVNELKKDRKSTRLNSSHVAISYAVFCLKKKKKKIKSLTKHEKSNKIEDTNIIT